LTVIEIARVKKSCRRCEKMVLGAGAEPAYPARASAGPNPLACVLASKSDEHIPLFRQNEIFARMGADIPDTTLVDWCGSALKTPPP
jgi:transposase